MEKESKEANASHVSRSSILVSPRQKGNPVLDYIKQVSWQYQEIVCDYIVGETTGILFLSLKYHRLHPEYIYTRISKLKRSFERRVLVILVDVENHQSCLKDLHKTSFVYDLILFCCWSFEEAAHYIQLFKILEFQPPVAIQEKKPTNYLDRVMEAFSSIRAINKTDAIALISHFKSIKSAIMASRNEFEAITGLGPTKVNYLQEAINGHFRSK